MLKENVNQEPSVMKIDFVPELGTSPQVRKKSQKSAKKKSKTKDKKKADKRTKMDLNAYLDNADLKQLLKVSNSTIVRLRNKKEIPFFKIGTKYYYPREFFQKSIMEKMENKHLL